MLSARGEDPGERGQLSEVHSRHGRPLRRRSLLDDDVGVGAGDAEGGDAGAARALAAGPGHVLAQERHLTGGPVDVRRRLLDVERAGQEAVPQGEDHLDDAGDAGGALGVADIGLDRAEPEGLLGGALAPVGVEQGLGLDGVAEGGAGAVALDRVDVPRREPGVGERARDDAPLRGTVGRGQPVAGAVLVDGGAADESEDVMPEPLRVGEALEQQHADALAPAGAVGGGGEGLATPVGREPALARELDEDGGRGHDGDAAGEGQRALPLAQRGAGEVQRDERGGAGGVEGDGGTLQAEAVGDAPGEDAAEVAGAEVALELLALGCGGLLGVVVVHGAGEDAGGASAQGERIEAGVLESLPADLEQEALLGVHGERLAGADAEELGIEIPGAGEKGAGARVGGAGAVGIGVVEPVEIPAAIGGEAADGVGAGGEQPPEILGAAHAAGVAAADADDRDGLLAPLLDFVQAGARLVQVGGDLLEVAEEFVLVSHADPPAGRCR